MKYFSLPILACFLTACPVKNCNYVPPVCQGTDAIIDDGLYKNGPVDHLTILDAEIIGDSIFIEFGSSGCDGSTWELFLVDANVIMKSKPEQRNIRLSLKNKELCEAYFTKTISFNIKPLQIQSNKIYLNLKYWNKELLYEY